MNAVGVFQEASNYFEMENYSMPGVWLFFQWVSKLPQNSTVTYVLSNINDTKQKVSACGTK